MVVQADVSSEDQVAAMVGQVLAAFGQVDILVNTAGSLPVAPIESLPLHRGERMLAVHLTVTFLCTRAVLPGMYERDYGRVINTASQLAYRVVGNDRTTWQPSGHHRVHPVAGPRNRPWGRDGQLCRPGSDRYSDARRRLG